MVARWSVYIRRLSQRSRPCVREVGAERNNKMAVLEAVDISEAVETACGE